MSRGAGSFLAKLAVVVCVVVVLAGGVVGFNFVSDWLNGDRGVSAILPVGAAQRSTILENIYLNNVYVGGLTADQALERLSEQYSPDLAGKQITVTAEEAGDARLEIQFAELNPGFDFTGGVEMALNYGADENESDIRERLAESPARLSYTPAISYDSTLLEPKVAEFLRNLERQPENATGERREGQFHIIEEIVGLVADVPATMELVREQLIADTSGTVPAVFRHVQPGVTAEALRSAQSLLGTFTTRITGAETLPRNINVINAANNINGTVVQPGEVFSTNHHFGAMTYANGYRYAPIIVQGEFVPGIGGGVCQVSSTLYMALLYAEMEIVERRNHSLRVGYIGWAMDATLAGDWIDLRWRNNSNSPIYVEAFVRNGDVTVNLFGYESRPSYRTLSFTPVHQETIAYGEDIVQDPELAYGERVVESRGTAGQRHALYKTVFENGVQADRYRINTSTYRAINAVVRVGTGGEAPDDEPQQNADSPDVSGLPTPPDSTVTNIYTGEEINVVPDPTPAPAPQDPPASTPAPELPDLSSWLNMPIPDASSDD